MAGKPTKPPSPLGAAQQSALQRPRRVHDGLFGEHWEGGGNSPRLPEGFTRASRMEQPQVPMQSNTVLMNQGGFYEMPVDGDFWNWAGVGGSATNWSKGTLLVNNPLNPAGYDFVGGQTTQNSAAYHMGGGSQPGSSLGARVYQGITTRVDNALMRIDRQSFYNCNCGISGGNTLNCYANCNCNCNCACACDCDCGDCMSCVPGWTEVTLADGSRRRIDEIKAGDMLKGYFGTPVRVKGLVPTSLGRRRIFSINGLFETTAEHTVWTVNKGLACIDPAACDAEKGMIMDAITESGLRRSVIFEGNGATPEKLEVGDILAVEYGKSPIGISEIADVTAKYEPTTPLYTLWLGDLFQMNGGAWISGLADTRVNWEERHAETLRSFSADA